MPPTFNLVSHSSPSFPKGGVITLLARGNPKPLERSFRLQDSQALSRARQKHVREVRASR